MSRTLWGWIGLLVGLILMGVGVVPVAIVASVLVGQWELVKVFAFLLVSTFGIRALSLYLVHSYERYYSEKNFPRTSRPPGLGERTDCRG